MAIAPIFIVGCPRSGTGLLRDLLRSHPSICIPLESHFIPRLYRAYGDPRNVPEATRLADAIVSLMDWEVCVDPFALARQRSCAGVIDLVFGQWARQQGKQRWGDKTPGYVLEIPTLMEMFPAAKIIHIYRDGRDTALSILRSHIGPENLVIAAQYWKHRVETGRAAGKALPIGSYHEVRYEGLLDEPDSTMRAVCSFVDEPFTPAVLKPDHIELRVRPLIFGRRDHSVASKVEIVATNQAKWKDAMRPEDRATFESIAGDLLRELGYQTEGRTTRFGTIDRLRARLSHAWWYALYRLNLGNKSHWARVSLWMWSAQARYRLRLAGIVGPPIRAQPRPRAVVDPGSPGRCAAPGAWPLVGHVPALLRDKLGFLSRCAADLGDVVELRVGVRTYLLNNPDDIGHVLIDNHTNYEKSERLTSTRGKRLLGSGLLTSSLQTHGPKRRPLRPLFHRGTISKMATMIVRNTQHMLQDWCDADAFDIENAMARLTRENIVAALFTADTRASAAALDRAIVDRQRYIENVFGTLLPLAEYLPTPVNLRHRKAIHLIDRFIYEAIEQRRRNGGPDDFLTMLLAARHEDGSAMTDAEVRDEALVFALTGYETVGEALTWTFYLLSEHANVADRVRAELELTLGSLPPEADDVSRLPYLDSVLAESMRLYPPTWIQVRRAIADDELPSGTQIPADSKLYLSQWVTHRTARYFPDPERFDPTRFMGPAPLPHPKHAYFPFGLGPRRCLGESYAKMQAVLILATVLQRGELTTVPGQRIAPEPGVILRPRAGLTMRYRVPPTPRASPPVDAVVDELVATR